jgi:hypothetical protein
MGRSGTNNIYFSLPSSLGSPWCCYFFVFDWHVPGKELAGHIYSGDFPCNDGNCNQLPMPSWGCLECFFGRLIPLRTPCCRLVSISLWYTLCYASRKYSRDVNRFYIDKRDWMLDLSLLPSFLIQAFSGATLLRVQMKLLMLHRLVEGLYHSSYMKSIFVLAELN